VAGLGVFALYALTLAPTTQFWDTSEYIATGHILGIPHPPGNPLFVLLARTWELLLAPLGLSPAVRINLFSAAMSASAHGLWFLVAERVLRTFHPSRAFRLAGAGVAVLISATAFTVWNQSNVNEKVYTVSLVTIALIAWTAFRWRDQKGHPGNDRRLLLIVFLLALSVGNHLMAFLAAPAAVAFVLLVDPRALLRWRLIPVAVGLALLGLSVHMYLPLRAALSPVINEANPVCDSLGGALTSILTWGQAGCAELSAALSRNQYSKPPLFPREAPLLHQVGNWLQYFDWQWARSMDADRPLFALARLPLTVLFAGLGLYGAAHHIRRDRQSGTFMAVLFGTLSLGLVVYLNFRYGFSFPESIAAPGPHEVRERDYFFIVGFSVWGVWAGIGLAALWLALAERGGAGLKRAAPVLALALLPLLLNASTASRRGDYAARDWAYNLLMSVQPYAVLFTNGDNDTFPLWYLQEVEGIRRDVTVIVTSYLNTDWYARQLRVLTRPCPPGTDPRTTPTRAVCQRPFDMPTEVGGLYVDPGPPAGSILGLDDTTITQISRSVPILREDTPYVVGNVRAALPGGQYLAPWMQFALAIMSESITERPIYFASSGDAPSALGLRDRLVREGLAFRVYNLNPAEIGRPGLVPMAADSPLTEVTGAWVDAVRTRQLVDEVFVHRGGLPDTWVRWPDHSTIGIPHYYAWVYLALAQAASIEGDQESFARYTARSEVWTELCS